MAQFLKITPGELEDALLEFSPKTTEESIAYYKSFPIDSIHQQMLARIQYEDDNWVRSEAQELYSKTKVIEQFLAYYDGIWEQENPYLSSLAAKMPYPLHELKTTDDYYDFLFQIPFLYTFELDFNAFLMVTVAGEALQLIRVNYVLFTVIDNFIETIAYAMFKTNDKYRNSALRPLEEIVAGSKASEAIIAIASSSNMMMGRAAAVARINIGKESSNNPHYGLGTSIIPFLQFHDFGRLWMEHLDEEYGKPMEYDADAFALLYVKALIAKEGPGTTFKVFLGLSAFFTLLYCRKQLLPLANQHQYPSGIERFLKLGMRFGKEDREKLAKTWNNVVLTVDHTLKTRFGNEIPLADTWD